MAPSPPPDPLLSFLLPNYQLAIHTQMQTEPEVFRKHSMGSNGNRTHSTSQWIQSHFGLAPLSKPNFLGKICQIIGWCPFCEFLDPPCISSGSEKAVGRGKVDIIWNLYGRQLVILFYYTESSGISDCFQACQTILALRAVYVHVTVPWYKTHSQWWSVKSHILRHPS